MAVRHKISLAETPAVAVEPGREGQQRAAVIPSVSAKLRVKQVTTAFAPLALSQSGFTQRRVNRQHRSKAHRIEKNPPLHLPLTETHRCRQKILAQRCCKDMLVEAPRLAGHAKIHVCERRPADRSSAARFFGARHKRKAVEVVGLKRHRVRQPGVVGRAVAADRHARAAIDSALTHPVAAGFAETPAHRRFLARLKMSVGQQIDLCFQRRRRHAHKKPTICLMHHLSPHP
ncbi:MAG: hypothetical protein BWX70_02813 [Verrucomicrobia bacterium ADurb.Bin070]|nr:MAG: hypothetical protein BWX70_02813 [Verrucomicrobia bacterium ADurb.Bin070]